MKSLKPIKCLLKPLFLALVLCFAGIISAQPDLPQRSITITPTQSINFGTFCVTGSGGTITVDWQGNRSSTGGIIILASSTAQPAIFEIKLCQGRNVIITFDATTSLTGSNGGSLTLDIGPTEKGINGASFPTISDCNFITPLRVGGTLHVPGTAVPGIYTGVFDITFNQE